MPSEDIRDPDQLAALVDAVMLVGSELELKKVLRHILEAAQHLTAARYAALGVLRDDRSGLRDFVYLGVDEDTAKRIGHLPEGRGVLGLLLKEPRPLRLADISSHPQSVGFPPGHPEMRSFLGVPIRVREVVFGNLYLTEKLGAAEFSETDQSLVETLARAAGLAIENARLHEYLAALELAAERERIARDLHDTVVQRIFALGLSLQSVAGLIEPPQAKERVMEAISELDETIRQIRTTIFELETPPQSRSGLRARVLELCSEASRGLGFEPEVRFSGPVDNRVPQALIEDLLVTLREALANVARHSKATKTEVSLAVDGEVVLAVDDNGVGLKRHRGPGRGLRNMAERAASHGGSFSVRRRPKGGTSLRWKVPLKEI